MVLYCRPAVFSITRLHQVTVFEPSHVQTTAKMGLNTREDEDKDLSDNMTRWFWLRCQIGIKNGICLAFPVALIDVNTFVCLPGVCWYTGTGMLLRQVVETHRNTNVAWEADVDAEVNKSLFPGTFRGKKERNLKVLISIDVPSVPMTIIINVLFLVHALLVVTLKRSQLHVTGLLDQVSVTLCSL